MQLIQNLGAYSDILELLNSIDGRNCTVREFFASSLLEGPCRTQSLYVLWKSPAVRFRDGARLRIG